MRRMFLLLAVIFNSALLMAQTPAALSSAEILLGMRKLKVVGTVLYVAAHPDDENTRLLAYLSKERMYRTGYLSITRGDGGQNLIGDEQGVELGLIRTQELLAARRIDGAEQFFTRAYDFGFSKSTEEALRIWDKEKILGDMVWVIRKYRPDVMLTRFPPDNRAGHGHHSASAVLAREAFEAAADPNRFPEHFIYGVTPWKVHRLMWNTFNFGGGANTISNDQLKIDVGLFNPLLGKSYGELASESRSQHKSQGFGVPRQRGQQFEYFSPVAGAPATADPMEGVITDWSRMKGGAAINQMVDKLVAEFSITRPAASVKGLVQLYRAIEALKEPDGDWKQQKLAEVKQLIEACAGLWIEAVTNQPFAVMGDSVQISFSAICRTDVAAQLNRVRLDSSGILQIPDSTRAGKAFYTEALQREMALQPYFVDTVLNRTMSVNQPLSFVRRIQVKRKETEPYWISKPMSGGSFTVDDQQLIGMAENTAVYEAVFQMTIEGLPLEVTKPVMYKFTDPVKGELYQKLIVYPPAVIKAANSLLIFKDTASKKATFVFTPQANLNQKASASINTAADWMIRPDNGSFQLSKGKDYELAVTVAPRQFVAGKSSYVQPSYTSGFSQLNRQRVRTIQYDHIPTITYFPDALTKVVMVDLTTSGNRIGYINGAGDFVAYCLQQMGYTVDILREEDVTRDNLKRYDAIVTGVRAYNVHSWLSTAYDVLMEYVQQGGVLLVQYNTSNQIGPLRSRIAPHPFTISRNRVTEEDAAVELLQPAHPVLNFPNKITANDFEGWVQERSVYEADNIDSKYLPLLGMNDAGEPQRKGSLLVVDYGKGRFVYSALAFFRQLPAGVPGAYRLMANLLAKPISKL